MEIHFWTRSRRTERQAHSPRAVLSAAARLAPGVAIAATLIGPLSLVQAAPGVTLHTNAPAGQPVGTAITWTAKASGLVQPVYRFSIGAPGGGVQVVRDFSQSASFTWMPMQEGQYTVQVAAKNGFTTTSMLLQTGTYAVTSRVTGARAVISATTNPLVPLYSAPACGADTLAVQYRVAGSSGPWLLTPAQPCRGTASMNVLVAGMHAATSYALRAVVTHGTQRTTSATQTFTTGRPPTYLTIPSFSVAQAASAQADQSTPLIFHAMVPTPNAKLANPVMTDRSGQLVWYYDTLSSGLHAIWPVRIMPNGTVLILGQDAYVKRGDDVLREVNLAGQPIQETNVQVVDAQLAQRGQEPIYSFHHDALPLPNGDLAVLGDTMKKVDGHDVMSDMLVVLNPDLQVVWNWDYFAHFTPPATFPKGMPTCTVAGLYLCALPDIKAIDWTHANAISWSPGDNNLVLSFRETSQVIKVDYRNGQGSGKVLWILGNGGTFMVASHPTAPAVTCAVASRNSKGIATPVASCQPSSPTQLPWFSGQHNANFINPTTMLVFDDGLVRCQGGMLKGCDSRGQEWVVNAQTHTATLKFDADLGQYWNALGSAQLLPNGDLMFAGGYAPPSREIEFSANGTKVFQLDSPLAVYRAFPFAGI